MRVAPQDDEGSVPVGRVRIQTIGSEVSRALFVEQYTAAGPAFRWPVIIPERVEVTY
jgi:hypothetical protein